MVLGAVRRQSAALLSDNSRTCGAASTITPISDLNQLRRQGYTLGRSLILPTSRHGVEKSPCPQKSPDAGAHRGYYVNGLRIHSVLESEERSKSVGMTPDKERFNLSSGKTQAESSTRFRDDGAIAESRTFEPLDTDHLPAVLGQDTPTDRARMLDNVIVTGQKLKYPHCKHYIPEKETPVLPLIDNAAARFYPATYPDWSLGRDTVITGRKLESPRCHTTSPCYNQPPLNVDFEVFRRHSRSLTSNLFTKGQSAKRRPTLMQERMNFYFAGRPVTQSCYFCQVADRHPLTQPKFPGYPGYPGYEQHPYKRHSLQGQRSGRRLKGKRPKTDEWFPKHPPRESVTYRAMDTDKSESWVQTRHGINAFDLNVRFDEMTDHHEVGPEGRDADDEGGMPDCYPKINVTITNTRTGKTSQTPVSVCGVYDIKEGSQRVPRQSSVQKPDLPWLNSAAANNWAPSEYELRQCLSDIWPFPNDFRNHIEQIRNFYCDEALLLERGRITKIRARKSPIYQLYRKSAIHESSAEYEGTEDLAQHDETMATTLTIPARDMDCKQWISFNTNDEPSIHQLSDIENESNLSQRTKLFSADSDSAVPKQHLCFEPVVDKRYNKWKRRSRKKSEHRRVITQTDNDSEDESKERCSSVERIIDSMYTKIHGPVLATPNGTSETPRMRNRRRREQQASMSGSNMDTSREPSETASAGSITQKHTGVQCSWPFIEQNEIMERLQQSSDTPLDKSQQEWLPGHTPYMSQAAGPAAMGQAGMGPVVKEYSMKYTSGTATSEAGVRAGPTSEAGVRAGPKPNKSLMIPSAVGIIDLGAAITGHPPAKTGNRLLRPDYDSIERAKRDNSSFPKVSTSPKPQTIPVSNTKPQSDSSGKDQASAKNKGNSFDFKDSQRPKPQPPEKSEHRKMDNSQEAPSFLFRDYYLRNLYSKTDSSKRGSKTRKTIAVGPGIAQSTKRRLSAEDRTADRVPDNLAFTRSFTFSMFNLPELQRDYNDTLVERAVKKTS